MPRARACSRSPKTRAQHRLRIIGGRWRGRRLSFIVVPGLRPTPDRVRETLFNWLAPVVEGARCLDLFAGSGLLGFEAASRGASEVWMLDRDARVVRQLQSQARALGAEQCRILCADSRNFLRSAPAEPYDVVFVDPPFGHRMVVPVCEQVERYGWVRDGALIYIEAESATVPVVPANWRLLRSQRAGQLGYHLAERMSAREHEERQAQ